MSGEEKAAPGGGTVEKDLESRFLEFFDTQKGNKFYKQYLRLKQSEEVQSPVLQAFMRHVLENEVPIIRAQLGIIHLKCHQDLEVEIRVLREQLSRFSSEEYDAQEKRIEETSKEVCAHAARPVGDMSQLIELRQQFKSGESELAHMEQRKAALTKHQGISERMRKELTGNLEKLNQRMAREITEFGRAIQKLETVIAEKTKTLHEKQTQLAMRSEKLAQEIADPQSSLRLSDVVATVFLEPGSIHPSLRVKTLGLDVETRPV